MINDLSVRGFRAVPYLETSALMLKCAGKVRFSNAKPNVLVGPNGSGKSALLNALSLRFLTHFTGKSQMDGKYITDVDAKDWWSAESGWSAAPLWLPGLTCKTDNAPALYFRPAHIPGNETSLTHALMCGYEKEARAHRKLVDGKSSGQQGQALLSEMMAALGGEGLPTRYGLLNWVHGTEPIERQWGEYKPHGAEHAEVLKALYRLDAAAKPLLLMDEPEQSLDARAEAALWAKISQADCAQVQIIVATHSLHPLLNRRKFNLIETEAGFVDEVLALLG